MDTTRASSAGTYLLYPILSPTPRCVDSRFFLFQSRLVHVEKFPRREAVISIGLMCESSDDIFVFKG